MRFFDFFKRQFLLMRVSGIPVRIDYRWFFVLAIMTWVMAHSLYSLIGNILTSFVFGLITTLIFFVSIFLHEFAHVFAARLESVHVIEIVLHPFGGLARFRREPDTPGCRISYCYCRTYSEFFACARFFRIDEIFGFR